MGAGNSSRADANSGRSVFDWNGIARLSDIYTEDYASALTLLQAEQQAFLAQEGNFRSPEYKWPHDSLHTWSRIWEYPYVYHHTSSLKSAWKGSEMPRVVDFGSGCTFFPFSVARLGCDVICADIDRVCVEDVGRAASLISTAPGTVRGCLINGGTLPVKDETVDLIYCISVLEHVNDFGPVIREMGRVLKPGAWLVLTVDLDLIGGTELGVETFDKMLVELDRDFSPRLPTRMVHPVAMLTSRNSTYPVLTPESPGEKVWFMFKQFAIKPLIGRKPSRLPRPIRLAVAGFVLERRA